MTRTSLLASGALAVALFVAPLQAWEAARSTSAKEIRVFFSVLPVAAFEHAPHRVVVQLTERKSGRHVSEAELDVISRRATTPAARCE